MPSSRVEISCRKAPGRRAACMLTPERMPFAHTRALASAGENFQMCDNLWRMIRRYSSHRTSQQWFTAGGGLRSCSPVYPARVITDSERLNGITTRSRREPHHGSLIPRIWRYIVFNMRSTSSVASPTLAVEASCTWTTCPLSFSRLSRDTGGPLPRSI